MNFGGVSFRIQLDTSKILSAGYEIVPFTSEFSNVDEKEWRVVIGNGGKSYFDAEDGLKNLNKYIAETRLISIPMALYELNNSRFIELSDYRGDSTDGFLKLLINGSYNKKDMNHWNYVKENYLPVAYDKQYKEIPKDSPQYKIWWNKFGEDLHNIDNYKDLNTVKKTVGLDCLIYMVQKYLYQDGGERYNIPKNLKFETDFKGKYPWRIK